MGIDVHALLKLVHALLSGSKLSLSQLGRHRAGSAFEKHHIKAADRLLATQHLHAERDGIYRAIARTLLAGIKRPVVIVDCPTWSPAGGVVSASARQPSHNA